ncbi:hypothetical protein LINPERPRIM_LOCUS8197 [Linum perenne]
MSDALGIIGARELINVNSNIRDIAGRTCFDLWRDIEKQRTAIAGEFYHADSLNFQIWISINLIVDSS